MTDANSRVLAHPATKSDDSDLITSLLALSKKSPKLVKSTTYLAPADPSITVRSWKMNEFKYYDVPSPFPTLARGLFSVELPQEQKEEKEPKHRIVTRGYDKFFNIGEVPWTTWESLKTHTVAPYILSLKSNGCIIFIAALTPEKLLITSKHAIGPVRSKDNSKVEQEEHGDEEGADSNSEGLTHAEVGEVWLRRYLKAKGRSEMDFAKVLWDNNWTAIAELCDDSFEEHVLPYPPELTGLHLHGLNTSTKAFHTLSQDIVDKFAEEWGFIRTLSSVCNTIEEVQEFTQKVGSDQVWEGQAVEGFVARTHVGTSSASISGDANEKMPVEGKDRCGRDGTNPYAPGSTFFFKVKFDEPYMMYRDWREVTKSLLSSRKKQPSSFSASSANSLPKNKMKRPETRVYAKWVIGEIQKDPKVFEDFGKGKGIIATRERFLKWTEETEEGRSAMAKAKGRDSAIEKVLEERAEVKRYDKTIIVPVGIPGCGKTSIAVALAHIFGFGHTQSDDVHAKKPAPVFIRNVMELLETNDVVIADKNNHLRQHRTSLREAVAALEPAQNVRLLALSYPIASLPQSTLIRVCGDRVTIRGDNHQTLRADKSGAKSHEEVVWGFITSFEDLAMDEVDEVIEMDLEQSIEDGLKHAVRELCRILGLKEPSDEKLKEGLDVARGYKPTTIKSDDKVKKAKGKKATGVRYFALLPEVDVLPILEHTFKEVEEQGSEFFEQLKNASRVTKRPHITLVHRKSLSNEADEDGTNNDRALWDRSEILHGMEIPPDFELKLTNVLWDGRVMAIVVDDLKVQNPTSDEGHKGVEFVRELPSDVRDRLHITVGTLNDSIPPVEAKALVERWKGGETEGILEAKLKGEGGEDLVVVGRVKGMQY
ncbi:tRNA ligase [Stygiomarasmius scandens]|uniref:tRNA ligase n=1 Tax=Marasmiellus scandens TaxID=2682957 RepID=A0ABR1JY61_9AGAR